MINHNFTSRHLHSKLRNTRHASWLLCKPQASLWKLVARQQIEQLPTFVIFLVKLKIVSFFKLRFVITDNDPESFWVPLKMIDWVYICKIPREKRFLSPPASASHEFCFKNSASSSERINSPARKIYNNLKLTIRPLSCNQFRCYLLKMSEEELISTLVRIHKAILKKKSLFLMCVKLNILQSISGLLMHSDEKP